MEEQPRRRRRRAATVVAAIAAGLVATVPAPTGGAAAAPIVVGPMDWPTYAHDQHRTNHGVTTLDPTSVAGLAQAWSVPTGDAVTASPIVVAGTVYVGSWDGRFYAVDARTGAVRWTFSVKPQPSVAPLPGEPPTARLGDITSDGGMITSTAVFVPARGNRPDLVVFGGGYTLYALRAADGHPYWEHDYTGRPEYPPDPNHDEARIFSSPAVVGDTVLFSSDADGGTGCTDGHGTRVGCRGYLAAADLGSGAPLWRTELDVDTTGRILNDGCGNVWASPTVAEALDAEYVAVSDCNFFGTAPYHERVLSVDIATGHINWVLTPPRFKEIGDPQCDWDFGATANLGTDAAGRPDFLGVGGKDGTYYRIDPVTGRLLWHTNVVFGGFAGGFIGTTAYDGARVYGATALGDFGRFESKSTMGIPVPTPCEPANPLDQPVQNPSIHSFDAGSGSVLWQGVAANSFGPTTVAGGMVFSCFGLGHQLQVRSAQSGQPLGAVPLAANCDSGITVAGNAVFVGTGSSEQGSPDGIVALSPLGSPPVIPAGSGSPGGGSAGSGQTQPGGGTAAAAGASAVPDTAAGSVSAGLPAAVLLAGAAALGLRRRRTRPAAPGPG